MLSVFEMSVLHKLKSVPRGRVTTYAALAQAIGRPRSVRAVGNALHKNPDAPQVPCHRVVRSDGSLGGYAGGAGRKARLLTAEGIMVRGGRIVNFENIFIDL